MTSKKKQRQPRPRRIIQVRILNEPSPERVLACQLRLLGWSESEIREAIEDDRREREAEK